MITTFLIAHPWMTTAALVACLVAGPPVGYLLSSHRRLAGGLGVVALLPVAVLTLVPTSRELTVSCAVEWSWPTLGAVELMANLVLFVPVALLFGVATQRPWVVLAAAILLSAAIETFQALVPALGRSCSTNDWWMNTLGAVLGTVLALLVLQLRRINTDPRAGL